jgi:hypothetical protein
VTAQTFILPVLRTSPVHIPRRDMVLASSDSLALRVTVVERDSPLAEALVLTGGMGGPALRMVVWNDRAGHAWDYGAPQPRPGDTLWSGAGVISTAYDGTFDVTIPAMAMSGWPRRCGYALALDWDTGADSEVLARGYLHIMPAPGGPVPVAEVITTNALDPITTD